MPKATAAGSKHKRKAQGTVICKCKTNCLKYSEATGQYEGPGQRVSPSERAKHRRDDRLRALIRQTLLLTDDDNGSQHIHPLPPSDSDETDWLPLIRAQIPLMLELHNVGPDQHLMFMNDPTRSGPYSSEMELLEGSDVQPQSLPAPNTGYYALRIDKSVNRGILEAENCLWELHRTLQAFQQTQDVSALQQEAYDALLAVDRQKQMHWDTLRGGGSSRPYFNTGE